MEIHADRISIRELFGGFAIRIFAAKLFPTPLTYLVLRREQGYRDDIGIMLPYSVDSTSKSNLKIPSFRVAVMGV